MGRVRTLLLGLAALSPIVLGFGSAQATPVTWTFTGTGLISCAIPTACVLPPQNFALGTFKAEDTSSGHATFTQSPISHHDVDGRDFGDDFEFQLTGFGAVSRTEPPSSVPQQPSTGIAQDFDISWVAVGGELIAATFDVRFTFDDALFSLTWVNLASDRTLGPCTLTQCTVSGFWESDIDVSSTTLVSEPTTLGLLSLAMLGLGMLYRPGKVLPLPHA